MPATRVLPVSAKAAVLSPEAHAPETLDEGAAGVRLTATLGAALGEAPLEFGRIVNRPAGPGAVDTLGRLLTSPPPVLDDDF